MKKGIKILIIIGVLVLLGAIILSLSLYTVREDEFACVARFSKIIKTENSAGLKFKMPFVDTVSKYPKNVQLYDIKPSDVYTKDKKAMIVDCYVAWKITDPLEFRKSLSTTEEAELRLDTIAYNNIKILIGTFNQDELINEDDPAERNVIYRRITEGMRKESAVYGIDIMDVKIKRFDLPDDNEQAVYTRMISERNQMAEDYRANGEYNAALIINQTDKEYNITLSDAELEAEEIKAEAEREYMRILAAAYNTDERKDFYTFIRSLDALKASLSEGQKTVILSKDSELAKLLLGVE